MPSLYADFTLQRHSNPDGYAANTLVWINALSKAAQAGLVPADGGDHDTLSLRTGDALLQSLETKEWGRPLALGPVIVGIHTFVRLLEGNSPNNIERGCFTAPAGSLPTVPCRP